MYVYLISFSRTAVRSCHSLLDCKHIFETLMIPAKQVCTRLKSRHRIGKFVIRRNYHIFNCWVGCVVLITINFPNLTSCKRISHFCRSKDTFVKFWDLDTQHCFRTLLTHKTEVYGLQVNSDETRLYTGSADNEIRVYGLQAINDEDSPSAGASTPQV